MLPFSRVAHFAVVTAPIFSETTDKYSAEEIKAMLAVADAGEADLIQFFLRTGVRDEEAAYMEWKDIDWKRQQVMVR